MLKFVMKIVQGFNISKLKTYVSVLTFNTEIIIHTYLTAEKETFNKVMQNLQNLQPKDLAFTYLALNAADSIFTNGSRNTISAKALVLLTDSSCNNDDECPEPVENAAQRLNDRGIKVFSFALSRSSEKDMGAIGLQPGNRYIRVNQFSFLKNINFTSDVRNLICEGILFFGFLLRLLHMASVFQNLKAKTALMSLSYQYLLRNSCYLDIYRAEK